MSAGPYGALMAMLAAAPSLANVSVGFGEENINAQDMPTPMVVVVPVGGTWNDTTCLPGYYKTADVNLQNIWMTREMIDLYCWGASIDPSALPVDHADATNELRQLVLQAFQNQTPLGLKFVPMSGKWAQMGTASVRYGRAYVLTVQVDITAPDVLPVYATVTQETLSPITVE